MLFRSLLAIAHRAAMDIHVQYSIPAFNSFGHIPRSAIAGSYGNSMFNFLRNCYTVFHSSCTILHSHKQDMKVPVFPHPSQHMLFSTFFYNSHLNGYEVVSHGGFDFHFPPRFLHLGLFSCLEKGSKATYSGLCLICSTTVSHLLLAPVSPA